MSTWLTCGVRLDSSRARPARARGFPHPPSPAQFQPAARRSALAAAAWAARACPAPRLAERRGPPRRASPGGRAPRGSRRRRPRRPRPASPARRWPRSPDRSARRRAAAGRWRSASPGSTRARACPPGTWRCFAVAHTIVPAVSSALKARRGEHQLPDGARHAVAGDGERGQRPGDVHERDVAPRQPAAADQHRAADGAEPAGGEDDAEVGRAPAQLLLDDERQQHLDRAP